MTDDKIRENRLRRVAERQGLRLERSRRRDPKALGYGTYQLVDPSARAVVAYSLPDGYGLDLDDVEARLMKGRKQIRVDRRKPDPNTKGEWFEVFAGPVGGELAAQLPASSWQELWEQQRILGVPDVLVSFADEVEVIKAWGPKPDSLIEQDPADQGRT